jgi:hypothetical protein
MFRAKLLKIIPELVEMVTKSVMADDSYANVNKDGFLNWSLDQFKKRRH